VCFPSEWTARVRTARPRGGEARATSEQPPSPFQPSPACCAATSIAAARAGLFSALLCSPKVEAWVAALPSGPAALPDLLVAIAARFLVVEKSPENLFRVPWLTAAFPTARFVLIRRLGAAVAASIAKFAPAAWYGWEGQAKWRGIVEAAALAGVRCRSAEDAGGATATDTAPPSLLDPPPTPAGMLARGWVEWSVAQAWGARLLDAPHEWGVAAPPLAVDFEDLATHAPAQLARLLHWAGLPVPASDEASGGSDGAVTEEPLCGAEADAWRAARAALLDSVKPHKARA
jgi:hypothetical protein